jgi:microcystin-dependent protein
MMILFAKAGAWTNRSMAQLKTDLVLVKADVGLGSVDNTADAAKAVLSATKLTTARNIDGVSFDGSADITVIAPATHAATGKTTPVDADETNIADSAASFVLKKVTWANIKATLKTYFDTLYQATGSYQPLDSDLTTIAGLTATTDNFMVAVSSAWASRTPAQVRTTLALVIGTNVQAWSAALDTWAGKTAPSGTVVGTTDTQNLTNKTMDSTSPTAFFYPGFLQPYTGRSAPTGWLMCDGSAVSRSTYSGLFAAICESIGTATMTIAAPGVVTMAAHGLVTGDQIYFTTTGALPTGVTANTLYYVVFVSSSTFNLATSRANAIAGTKITTTGSQSGVHTLRWCPYGLGDGSTTFNVPDFRGRTIAGADAMGGTAASRLTLADALGSYGNVGASGGEQRHTMTTGELVAHSHTVQGGTTAGGGASLADHGGTAPNAYATSSVGSTTPFNLISPTAVANYLIKT